MKLKKKRKEKEKRKGIKKNKKEREKKKSFDGVSTTTHYYYYNFYTTTLPENVVTKTWVLHKTVFFFSSFPFFHRRIHPTVVRADVDYEKKKIKKWKNKK